MTSVVFLLFLVRCCLHHENNLPIFSGKRECLNVGTVPTFKMLNVGTVPTFKMLNIGTVPTFKKLNVGTLEK